jgi:hypothetical protein
MRAELCDPNGAPTFDGSVGADDDPSTSVGLFDAARADSPIAGWSVLFVPYCSGDLHIGDRVVDYKRTDGSTFAFAHVGARNTRAALDWLGSRKMTPAKVLVGGESAGAVAASRRSGRCRSAIDFPARSWL